MKQLSIRILAPFSSIHTLLGTILQFTIKKLNQVVTMPQRIKGQWRLYLNYCPECNSVAPTKHSCDVCDSDTRAFFHWNDDVKKAWWEKYAEKHQIIL
jgi:hypothetical protein